MTENVENDCSRPGLKDCGRGLTINEKPKILNSTPNEGKVEALDGITSSEEPRDNKLEICLQPPVTGCLQDAAAATAHFPF